MLRIRILMLAFVTGAVPLLSFPTEADAGPLLDWIRGCRRPSCLSRNTACYTPQVAAVAPNAYGLQPGQCAKTCQQTCARTVVNYVPVTAYRTDWKQVPVTTYKPVTNSDPCTGCTVTCMRPCTTYTYQMQRVPYTTYRPEYRTETYQVPVTTITNDCATGNCAPCQTGCTTCGTAGVGFPTPAANFAPTQPTLTPNANGTYYEYPATNPPIGLNSPTGTITTEGSYNTSTQPADIVPALQGINPQSSVRPVLDQMRSVQTNWTTSNQTHSSAHPAAPAVLNRPVYAEQMAESPIQREWNYTPVRLASHTTTTRETASVDRELQQLNPPQNESLKIKGVFRPTIERTLQARDLNGWVEVK